MGFANVRAGTRVLMLVLVLVQAISLQERHAALMGLGEYEMMVKSRFADVVPI